MRGAVVSTSHLCYYFRMHLSGTTLGAVINYFRRFDSDHICRTGRRIIYMHRTHVWSPNFFQQSQQRHETEQLRRKMCMYNRNSSSAACRLLGALWGYSACLVSTCFGLFPLIKYYLFYQLYTIDAVSRPGSEMEWSFSSLLPTGTICVARGGRWVARKAKGRSLSNSAS